MKLVGPWTKCLTKNEKNKDLKCAVRGLEERSASFFLNGDAIGLTELDGNSRCPVFQSLASDAVAGKRYAEQIEAALYAWLRSRALFNLRGKPERPDR